jgi:hypothetical protein
MKLFRDHAHNLQSQEVPPPFGDNRHFEPALIDMIQDACKVLAELVKQFAPKT